MLPRPDEERIERFTRAERYVHWATTVLMLALIATGAVLYNDQLAIYTGHRQFIAVVHLYSGFRSEERRVGKECQ